MEEDGSRGENARVQNASRSEVSDMPPMRLTAVAVKVWLARDLTSRVRHAHIDGADTRQD